MDILSSALKNLNRVAVVAKGSATRYGHLLEDGLDLCSLLARSGKFTPKQGTKVGPRVALFLPPGPQYVSSTWGTWMAGGTAVPLCFSHPDRELQYVIENSGASFVVCSESSASRLHSLAHPSDATVIALPDDVIMTASQDTSAAASGRIEETLNDRLAGFDSEEGCLIVYTSGTTGRPKGALHSHRSILSQVRGLVLSWGWVRDDRILHGLPLHHNHGIINALYCAHYSAATVEFLDKFSPGAVWRVLQRKNDPISVYMGVPTMYTYLLAKYDEMTPEEQQNARAATAGLRLCVVGSAACPLPIMNKWKEISGTYLLERYGMTEIGMALSNPLHGERRPGFVGLPLPGIEVKVDPPQGPGELLVRGSNLFSEYWNKPEATREAFDNGWFKTGDIAVFEGDPPYWKLMGRSSVDIIKSGGFKISALQIENVLLTHPAIRECAVLGIPDEALGEVVAAVIGCNEGHSQLSLKDDLADWLADKIPSYQIPKKLVFVEELPRNVMGKVNKKELKQHLFGTQ